MPPISLQPECATLATCEAVHAQFLDAFARGGPLSVDLSCVSEIDVTGLQLVLAAAAAAQASGTPMTLEEAVSPAAAKAFARAGLDPLTLGRPRPFMEPQS